MKQFKMVVIIFVVVAIGVFRQYFFGGKVPLPFNLLVSFYSPWKYVKWDGYPLGVPNKPLGYDNLKLFYPLRKFTTDEFLSLHLPLWNPYVFSGSVHHATYQSAIFYPLSLLYYIFPQADAWSILIIIQPILAGIFTYLFIRSLNLSGRASLFGALGFAFSGWLMAHWEEVLVIEHSLLWMPLALFASNCIWHIRRPILGVCLLITSLVMSLLAGFPQIILYVFATVLIWNIYKFFSSKPDQDRKTPLFVAVISIFSSICVSAIQWVPALEAYFLSPRIQVDSSYIFKTFLSPFVHLVTFLVPDFWGNPGSYNYFAKIAYLQERTIFVAFPILIFFILSFFSLSRRSSIFWKAYTLTCLSLGFSLPTSWIFYLLRVPILSVAQPVRIFCLSTFGVCVLSSIALDSYDSDKHRNIMLKIVKILFLGMLALCVFTMIATVIQKSTPGFLGLCHFKNYEIICSSIQSKDMQEQLKGYSTVSLRNLFIPSLSLFVMWGILVLSKNNKKNIIYVSLALIIFSGLYYGNKILYFSERRFEYPDLPVLMQLKALSGYNRVWSYGDAYILRSMLSYFKIYSPEGYEALFPYKYGRLLGGISSRGKITSQIQRNDATLSETGQYEKMTHNPIRLRVMSLLGVKYILEHKEVNLNESSPIIRFPQELFLLAWEDNSWRIWEYRNSLPRAYLVQNVIRENIDQKILDDIFNPSINLRKTVILKSNIESILTQSTVSDNLGGQADIVKYEPSEVTVRTISERDSWLVLSDNYYPGWEVYIDGIKDKIYEANFTLRGVKVANGNHVVRFIYNPRSFKIGVSLSIFGLLLAITFVGAIARFRYRLLRK